MITKGNGFNRDVVLHLFIATENFATNFNLSIHINPACRVIVCAYMHAFV